MSIAAEIYERSKRGAAFATFTDPIGESERKILANSLAAFYGPDAVVVELSGVSCIYIGGQIIGGEAQTSVASVSNRVMSYGKRGREAFEEHLGLNLACEAGPVEMAAAKAAPAA
jgi:hypothetical protein